MPPLVFNNWDELRDQWYYPKVLGRKWDRRPNTIPRRTDQRAEQQFHDMWRRAMGYDAPWTDVMLLVDHHKAIALAELKQEHETYPDWQSRAQLDLAARSALPFWLIVAVSPAGPFSVQLLFSPDVDR